jgi:hypothetical protein
VGSGGVEVAEAVADETAAVDVAGTLDWLTSPSPPTRNVVAGCAAGSLCGMARPATEATSARRGKCFTGGMLGEVANERKGTEIVRMKC